MLLAPGDRRRSEEGGGGVGRTDWLRIGGDGGLKTASVLLSVCGRATQHRLNRWSYLRGVPDQLDSRSAGDVVSEILPDAGVPDREAKELSRDGRG